MACLGSLPKCLTQIGPNPAGAYEIVGILKKRPSVTQITLSQNALGDEGLQIILQYLTHNAASLSVTSLTLNSCKLGDTALEQLGSYIRNHRTLQNLSLQDVSPLFYEYLCNFILCHISQNVFKVTRCVLSSAMMAITNANIGKPERHLRFHTVSQLFLDI